MSRSKAVGYVVFSAAMLVASGVASADAGDAGPPKPKGKCAVSVLGDAVGGSLELVLVGAALGLLAGRRRLTGR